MTVLSRDGGYPVEAGDGRQAIDLAQQRLPRLSLTPQKSVLSEGWKRFIRVRPSRHSHK
jgi:hypothetical protein